MSLLMDLGYNDQILLVAGGEHQVPLPERKIPTSLGFNIQGQETRGYVGRLPAVGIGGYELKDIIVSYVPQDQSSGTSAEAMVGLGLLSHFNLVFDYSRRRLLVEPNKSFKRSFEYNMTGFVTARSTPGTLVVREVYVNSPADKAGLKEGDRLLAINGRPVTDYDFFELLDLYGQKGETLKLSIERDGEKKDISLKLERVI
jgi:membrane-associated protease RseP (regulator of RpoE activity)